MGISKGDWESVDEIQITSGKTGRHSNRWEHNRVGGKGTWVSRFSCGQMEFSFYVFYFLNEK